MAAGTAAGSGRTPLDLPLDRGGTTFIEASAGTGKTHALTTLVARLVIEDDWPLDRILVVTFTRSATAELRDRIRRVLGAVLAAVRARVAAAGGESATPEFGTRAREPGEARGRASAAHPAGAADTGESGFDPQARELLAAWEHGGGRVDRALARRLEAAMRDIDRANIHTIHGFCQRVLADHAFESGFPFGFDVSGSDGGAVAGAVRDFWRRRLHSTSMLVTRYAVDRGFLPAELTTWVSSRRAKTRVAIVGGDPPAVPIETREAAWRDAFEAVRATWEADRRNFLSEMHEGPWLNRSRYRRSRTERELAAIEGLFAAPDPWLPEEGVFGRYGRERLSDACKRNFAVPGNALFDAFDRLEVVSGELRSACDQWLRWNRREILTEVRASIRRSVREDRRLAYDDLLIELDDALEGAEGKRLAERVRRELPCALIDEYQDTDPIQTRIFARIYGSALSGSDDEGGAGRVDPPDAAEPNSDPPAASAAGSCAAGASGQGESRLVDAADPGSRTGRGGAGTPARGERPGPFIVVGDPKQSIYRFRGADVFAYLASRRAAHGRLDLDRNWRSVPALVDAVNALFADAAPFVTPEIEYRPVSAAEERDRTPRLASGECAAALELWLLPRMEEGKPLAKKDVNPAIAGATSDEIVRLLECGARGEATIEGEALTGGDVAVLVRTREQGRQIAAALRERGVRSVEIDDGSVFHSREAEQLERLLWVLAEPGRESGIRGALAGDLFGLDARTLLTLGDDEDAWSGWVGRLAHWRRHWESRGIGSILLRLLEREEGAKHLLEHHDGARRLTNCRHLAELLAETETRDRLAPAELATWLNHRRTESDHRDDTVQLRLESDEQLVKIVTVHGAKGLEFPVVFCPFAWDARGPSPQADAMYHLGAADDYREVLDLNPDETADAMQWIEEFSESVRLLYVALTRAELRCVVAWGQVRGAEHSPLAWLLHRSGSVPAAMSGPVHDGPESNPDTGRQDAAAAESERGAGRAERDASAVPERGTGRAERDAAAVPERGTGRAERDAAAVAERGTGRAERDAAAVAERGTGRAERDAAAVPQRGSGASDPNVAIAALRAVADRFTDMSASEWLGEIDAFARRVPHAVTVVELDSERPPVRALAISEDARPALAALEPARPLRQVRSLTSFSALCAETPASAGDFGRSRVGRDDAEIDRPDHDQRIEPDSAGNDATEADGGAGRERNAFTFPRGPVAGSCLHQIFERLDAPHEPGPDGFDVEEICGVALADFGIAGEWRAVARGMVERTRALRLHEPEPVGPDGSGGSQARAAAGRTGEFRLADPLPRLVELEFHFPVDGLDRRHLGALLAEHGYPDPFDRPVPDGAGGSPPPIHGFLRGFIDLVVEHAGRWYVVDYKSNWLGPTPDDYASKTLNETMRAGGYTLQSLIYLVALHRYLATRLPGYEYERHIGGAFYLFVRGIDPAAGMDRGVHFDRPSPACLHALDACFGGGSE